jgi:hypothetical protein
MATLVGTGGIIAMFGDFKAGYRILDHTSGENHLSFANNMRVIWRNTPFSIVYRVQLVIASNLLGHSLG